MSMSSHCAGRACDKYRLLQELDKREQDVQGDLRLEKLISFEGRTSNRLWCVCLLVAAVFFAVTIVLYTVFLPIDFSDPLQVFHPVLVESTSGNLKSYPVGSVTSENESVVSCYYNAPSLSGEKQLMPFNINPHLCTHINIAFANITNKEIFIDESLNNTLFEILRLKQQNPKLKILLSVGGAGNNNGFSDMVVDHASRKIFIRSIKRVLRSYSLDGIDLDWEFPALHNNRDKRGRREKQHFSQLLREIRMEFYREKRNYILTIAAAAPETIVNVSYDVDQINMYVDYVNIMTYDFHYYTKYTPFTGLNSPLYPRPAESLYLATLNINYTINMYISKGLDRNKIVVGIPTYGHTFTLVNVNNPSVGSPASGIGSLGGLGFVDYPDVCMFLRDNKNVVEVNYEQAARVPYLHLGKEWVSYDNMQSVKEKAVYIKSRGLRGAMIYSLNADDYEGACRSDARGSDRFPLALSVRNALASGLESVAVAQFAESV